MKIVEREPFTCTAEIYGIGHIEHYGHHGRKKPHHEQQGLIGTAHAAPQRQQRQKHEKRKGITHRRRIEPERTGSYVPEVAGIYRPEHIGIYRKEHYAAKSQRYIHHGYTRYGHKEIISHRISFLLTGHCIIATATTVTTIPATVCTLGLSPGRRAQLITTPTTGTTNLRIFNSDTFMPG